MTRHTIRLAEGADIDGFRKAVRRLIAAEAPPPAVHWSTTSTPDLFGDAAPEAAPPVALPKGVGELIDLIVCHRDSERYGLLYELIWRMRHGERALLQVASDPLVHRLEMMRKAIRRDLHKMHAFLRFRRIETDGRERFVAWFEPDHFILDATAGFFIDRFRSLNWSILTPIGALHWDGATLAKGPPAKRGDAPESDEFEAGWAGYYRSTFNPARVNIKAMQSEMPKKYWRNMPETHAIAELLREAPSRVEAMIAQAPTIRSKRTPQRALEALDMSRPQSLDELNRIIAAAEPFVSGGTRAVLGEGPMRPSIALVGEQPGDQEDIDGRPFVGPAGKVLDRALAAAGIDRSRCYLTNAVKHFKFEQRGKRRLHQSPTAGEVKRYRWWLTEELDLVKPKLIVALGATAAQALADRRVSVTRERGPMAFQSADGFVTVHPSFLLRIQDEQAQADEYAAFVADLRRARALAA